MSKTKTIKHLNVNFEELQQYKNTLNTTDLENQMKAILNNKIHGLSFSPYLEGQSPADFAQITDTQIAERLSIVEPYTKWIRTFSVTNGNEVVPRIAKEKKFNTCVGIWIGDDEELNEIEIMNGIEIAKKGHADILAVGNEVLLREDIEVDKLIEYIRRVKEAVPEVQVGYVDAYYEFANYEEIVDEVDVLLANCYPFWEKTPLEYSVEYMKKMYKMAVKHSKGKKVIISETGWPTKGEQYGGAIPSYENALIYFVETHKWAMKENIDILYFSSFDETWKIEVEGEYGAYWGLWDKDGKYKFNKKTGE